MGLVRQASLFLALLVLPALVPRAALAHEVRPSIATLAIAPEGSLELHLTLNLEATMAGIGPDHTDTSDSPTAPLYDELRGLPPEALRAAFSEFKASFLEGVDLRGDDGEVVPLSIGSLVIPEAEDLSLARYSEITLEGELPATGALTWGYAASFGNSVIRLQDLGTKEIAFSEYVDAGGRSQPIIVEGAPQGLAEVVTNYLRVGFLHVLPLGLDHILFVVGLFLLSPRASSLAWQVSAFTLAHTLTLGLAATGWLVAPSQIVEVLIAASIAYVAVENLFTSRLHPWRPLLVFGFGLLHGLGFAGVLQEIGLPEGRFVSALVAFNVGVELAQLTVIAGCFVLTGWAMGRSWYRQAIVVPASVAIAAMAVFWILQRSGVVA